MTLNFNNFFFIFTDCLSKSTNEMFNCLNEQEQSSSPLYCTPNFIWTDVNIRLLSDLLGLIEEVVDEWNQYF